MASVRSAGPPATTAYGRALGARRRPGFDVAPVMLTWQLAVFVVASDADRRAFAVVPGRQLGRFLGRLDRGQLDDTISRFLAAPAGGRRMPARPLVARPGLYDALHLRPALLPPERALVNPGLPA